MKELLKKGDAEVPKRSQSIATNLVSVDTFAMQTPNPERQMTIGAASFKAAGFVNYDNVSKNRQAPAIDSGL